MADSVGTQAALGALLAGAVEGVVQAQRQLDTDARQRLADFIDTPRGGLALPPLWYTLADVQIDLVLAASLRRLGPCAGAPVRLDAQLLNPTAVSLFGHSAASGLQVQLRLAPREAAGAVAPVLPASPAPTAPPVPAAPA